jgi:hypothetical protein
MRLIKNKIEHNGSGTVTLCPEEPEDMVPSLDTPLPQSIPLNLTQCLPPVARIQLDPPR